MRAAHGLFRLAREQGDNASAAGFALSAQGVYDPDATGAPELLLDLARFWMDVGDPARARAALRRAVPRLLIMPPAWQLPVFALTARARATPEHPQSGGAAVRAAWVLMADDGIAEEVRYAAAVDLAHAARVAGNLAAFKRAKRSVFRFAPQADFADMAERMAKLWPEGESPRMERAS
jgi:hypothetical protein